MKSTLAKFNDVRTLRWICSLVPSLQGILPQISKRPKAKSRLCAAHLLTVLLLTFGCQNSSPEKSTKAVQFKVDANASNFTVYQSDSVVIDLEKRDTRDIVSVKIGDRKTEYDLQKLNIPTKTPELVWVNGDYACMVTWWSQAQSRHIFLPCKRENEFIYLNKDIEAMDSIHNNILYLDTVTENPNQVVYTVENLLTRKNKSLTLPIGRRNGNYPFCDKVNLEKNKLILTAAGETKSLDISAIDSNF